MANQSIDPEQDIEDSWRERWNALRAELLLVHQEAERHAKSGILEWDERTRWRSVLARTRKALGL